MFNFKFLNMKKFTQFSLIGTIVLSSMIISNAQTKGPILASKLETPENVVKQNIKKRSQIWVNGQWKVENNKYVWVSGHWKSKKVGYIYVDGKWSKSSNGWSWTEGYWKQIPLKKWMNLYA